MSNDAGTYETIIYRVEDGIAHLILNRPEALNSFNRQMTHDVVAVCGLVKRNPAVRVVIVSGAGDRAFCAGMDLKERAVEGAGGPVANRAVRNDPPGWPLHEAVAALEQPTIAALHGYAVGGGLELALACDLRVASDDAKLGLMEIRRGIIPGAGGTQRLPRLVGKGHALKLALTGEPIDVQEAYRIGLVNEVVPRDQLMAAALRLAKAITQGAPIAARYIKEAIHKGLDLPLEAGLRLETDLSVLLSTSEDAREGPRAFAEKRAAVWQGH